MVSSTKIIQQSTPRGNVMHPSVSLYRRAIVLLSLASTACLFALAARYAAVDARYDLALRDCAYLTFPALICTAFWIFWNHPLFRVGGYSVALLLFVFCAGCLIIGPVGGDMDFGAPFVAVIAALGCLFLSVIGCAMAGLLAFRQSRMHNEPLQPIARSL